MVDSAASGASIGKSQDEAFGLLENMSKPAMACEIYSVEHERVDCQVGSPFDKFKQVPFVNNDQRSLRLEQSSQPQLHCN
ncbi:hypothetical protein FEM48_Zijuj08G0192200 [Ziziphus jujuba var. spinosa]|uniref:Uncharacterized protein n=1 Tax=Ziziphus jujuba var. spinosa TaxID=714518 RepID=A0A978V0W0_ZIZJJ|nr:hypothetical protein FEM48_Zijuj08G0192200 [Ziziphus jujuba var. spinosa]